MKKKFLLIIFAFFLFVGFNEVNAATMTSSKNETVKFKYANPSRYSEIGKVYADRRYKSSKKIEKNFLFNIEGSQYKDSDGDDAYCLQPGKDFKESTKYCLNYAVDYTKCTNTNGAGISDPRYKYVCGLAYMMLKNVDANGKRVYNYSYGEMLTALRMWSAYKTSLSGYDEFSIDFDHFSFIGNYRIINNFYLISANQVINNPSYATTGVKCEKGKNKGLMCTSGGNKSYLKALQLFKEVYDGQPMSFDTNGQSISGISIVEKIIDKDTETITVEIPIDLSIPANAEKYKNAIKVKLYYWTGKKWQEIDVSDDVVCQKNLCYIENVIPELNKVCTTTKNSIKKEIKVSVSIEDLISSGVIKQYVPCGANDETDQIMMLLDTVQKKTSSTNQTTDYIDEATSSIVCEDPCVDDDSCPKEPSTSVGEDGKLTCSGSDGYDKAYVKDPFMSCIINSCDETFKNKYDKSNEFGVNTNTCKIYCREETEFFLANKTSVYAGMQFQYDIGSSAIVDSNGNIIEPFTVNQKLSSVVIKKRECATEVYYDKAPSDGGSTWVSRYNSALVSMVEKWNEWSKWKALEKSGFKIVEKSANRCTSAVTSDSACCSLTGCSKVTNSLYFWPNETGSVEYTKYNAKIKNGNVTIEKGKDTAKHSEGSAPTSDSANPGYSEKCTANCNDPNKATYSTYCSSCSKTSGRAGADGSNTVPAKVSAAETAFKNAAGEVVQLIYDLYNCNLYGNNQINSDLPKSGVYGGVIGTIKRATAAGSTKDQILKEALETVVEMSLEYEDKNYGEKTELANATKIRDDFDSTTKYCVNKNDSSKDCYKTTNGAEVKLTGSNSKQTRNLTVCNSSSCSTQKISLPKNDYATFSMYSETDFWQEKEYYTEAFTGRVVGLQDVKNGTNFSALAPNIYPVSLDTESGDYDINWDIEVGKGSLNSVQKLVYACYYKVYNTTTSYDCDYTDENGNIDWKKCANKCYNVNGGVADICIDSPFDSDKKSLGFIYRNVDLDNLFPTDREIGTNWANATDVINEIQKNADDIWTDEYLEYSFTLDPVAINKIREYNDTKNGIGGYSDNSIYACVSDGTVFNNCRSKFLDTYNIRDGLGVIVNKSRVGGDYQ